MKKFILLRQAMLAQDLNQNDLANIMGCSRSAVTARMKGTADFTAGEMLRIGRALGLQSADYYRFFLAETAAQLEGKQ